MNFLEFNKLYTFNNFFGPLEQFDIKICLANTAVFNFSKLSLYLFFNVFLCIFLLLVYVHQSKSNLGRLVKFLNNVVIDSLKNNTTADTTMYYPYFLDLFVFLQRVVQCLRLFYCCGGCTRRFKRGYPIALK